MPGCVGLIDQPSHSSLLEIAETWNKLNEKQTVLDQHAYQHVGKLQYNVSYFLQIRNSFEFVNKLNEPLRPLSLPSQHPKLVFLLYSIFFMI